MWRIAVPVLSILAACAREVAPPPAALQARPLREREAMAGRRFERLPSSSTQLTFTNELRRENIVAYVYMGAGVAAGDYDGDGLPDVYLVSQDGPNKLFRQVAPLVFEDVTEAAGGLDGGDAWGTAAVFADIDGDGDLDLFVCNLESPNLLYLNQGDGTFRECAAAFGLATVAASTGAAFADFDNDGDLDLYLLTNRVFKPRLEPEILAEVTLPGNIRKTRQELGATEPTFRIGDRVFMAGQRDRLFRNDGKAGFVDVTDAVGLDDHGNGLSVVWWDYDGDGWLDLYVANDFQSPDHLWRNIGGKRFEDVTAQVLPYTAFFGMGCDFGDLDGDGRLDLCVADMSSTTHYMGKMLMGSMDQHRWFLMNARPQQYMRNAVYVNTGVGRFLEAAWMAGLASTDWTWAVRFADLDEDGRLDCFFTNGIPVFADNPDIGERVTALWQQRRYDEALDVLRTMPRVDERNIARRNLGDLQFVDIGAEWGLDELGVAHGAVFCDLDRDGDLDLIVNNLNAEASLFVNRSSDQNRLLVELRGTISNSRGVGSLITVEAGGMAQIRLISPTRGYMSACEPIEHFGLGPATRIDRLTVRWPTGAEQVFHDLAANQHLTIREDGAPLPTEPSPPPPPAPRWFERRDLIPHQHRERDFDDYALQPLLPHRLSRLGPGLAVGDMDGDGLDDVFVGGAAGQAGVLWRARGDGAFVAVDGPWSMHAACEDLGALFVDVDGDGALDLYVASGGIEAGERTDLYRDRLYLNDGRGRFLAAPADVLPDLRLSSSCVVAADYDGDGDLDLFVGCRVVPGRFPESPGGRLLRNDDGRFVDVTAAVAPQLAAAGMVTGAVWADIDGDGRPDLCVAASWQPVRVFRNDGGKRLVDDSDALGLGGLRGQWQSITAADLDGDGDLDLVVTNLGLNTKYSASPAKPLRLYGGDFDDNGTFDVIEAKSTGRSELPVRGLSCSSQAMPFVRQRFPTYDSFARAQLSDIYGPDVLGACLVLECNELRHVVLENRGTAFVAHPLPRVAQISIGFGVVAHDVDGDGLPDIALAHNWYSPEPETGRFAGGLGMLLHGRPGLRLEPVPAERSGIVLPEDAMALAWIDLDGDQVPDLVATTNDGPVRTFVARRRPGLAVRLAGPAGNPTGVGARVELLEPGGKVQRRWITAGDSYLSQSAPVAWFPAAAAGAVLAVVWPDGGRSEQREVPATGAVVIAR